MALAPGPLPTGREAPVVAQEHLRDAVAGAHQVAAHVLAGPHEVAHRLLPRRGLAHRLEPAGEQQPDEVL
jgi:hypothetical protein